MKTSASVTYTLIYDGSQDPSVKQYYVTSFNLLPLTAGSYDFVVIAFNWVGMSLQSPALTVTLPLKVLPTSVVASGLGLISAEAGVAA